MLEMIRQKVVIRVLTFNFGFIGTAFSDGVVVDVNGIEKPGMVCWIITWHGEPRDRYKN